MTIDIKPEKTAPFIEAMPADARGSVADEPGCVRFDIIRNEQNPNRIHLYEAYWDKAVFDARLKALHFPTWQETVKDFFGCVGRFGEARKRALTGSVHVITL